MSLISLTKRPKNYEEPLITNCLDEKLSTTNIPEDKFLHFAKAITLFPEDSTDYLVQDFVNRHFDTYSYLFLNARCVKNQVKHLQSKGIQAGIKYTDKDDELTMHTDDKVQVFIDKLKENPEEDFTVTQFGIIPSRCIDIKKPMPPTYRIKDWMEGYQAKMVVTYANGNPWWQFVTRHTYLLLTDDNGNVTTVGSYPEKPLWGWGRYMRQETQVLVCPDFCDCKYPKKNRSSVTVDLTKSQYDCLMRDISSERLTQARGEKVVGDFNYFTQNCTVWAYNKLLEHTDITLIDLKKLETTILESLLATYMPKSLSLTLDYAASAIFALGPFILKGIFVKLQGGLEANPKNPSSQPIVNGWFEQYRPRFAPFISGLDLIKAIEKEKLYIDGL
jgi:hypothetical protein